jgi:PAS domain S-box-containing protein
MLPDFGTDNTASESAELKLRENQERLMFALESAHMGTWEFDLDSEWIISSRSMLDLWGIDPANFDNSRAMLQSKVHPDDLEKMRHAIDQAIQERSVYELEYRIIPAPGKIRWVSSRGRCTYETGTNRPKRLSGVVFDITERKLAEQERARLYDISQQAIAARDSMISISAHELLTPISGLKIQAQLLKRKLELGQNISRDALIKIATQTDASLNRLTKLVSDMLDVSRIATGKLTIQAEPVNLSRLVNDVIERSIAMTGAAGCDVRTSIEPDVIANVDSYRIEQVLANLMSNACRYAYGKPIEIALELKAEAAVCLSVADQGIGIAKENHQKIFEKFERATTLNQKAGMGLGLFIARQIVEAHGGSISVDSEPGKGAKFMVDLPLEIQRRSL